MGTRNGYTTRKVSTADRSEAMLKALRSGKRVRITPGQRDAILRRSAKAGTTTASLSGPKKPLRDAS